MTTASVRDLRYRFPEIERRLRAGETIGITKRGRAIGRLSPPHDPTSAEKPVIPDIKARQQRIFGDQVLKVSNAELLAAERERF